MLFHYGNCKNDLYELTQLKHTHEKRIHELSVLNTDLMNQVQEGKAMFHYQTMDLEKQIERLKVELGSRKCVMDSCEEQINKLSQENDYLKRDVERLSKERIVDASPYLVDEPVRGKRKKK